MSPAICASANISGTSPSSGWNLGVQRRDRKLWTTIAERLEADVAVLQLTLVELEEMLKQLMAVALPNPRIRGDEIAALITALAQILPLSSGLLCSEFARFVQKCCSRERVQFSSAQLKVVMTFFLNFIKTCPSWYTANSIRALGQVLHDNADRASVEFELLFAVLLKHLDPSGVDIEARYAATSCVSNICTQAGKTPEVYHYFSSLLRMVVENFRQQALGLTKGQDDRILVKACTSSMKCIFTIIVSNFDRLSDLIIATLPSLLTSMRQVVGYGLVLKNDQNDVMFSCQEELHPTDSDSSVCGSDGSTGGRQVGDGLLARLRISVLYTLEAIAQHFPKSITSSMGLYLPEQTTPYMTLFNNTPSVLTLLIADPSEKARMTAAKFLDVFWDKIPLKMYFRRYSSSGATTVAPTSSMSFASMPKRISLMLYQVHVTLVYCIQHEKESVPLAQILKSTASVIQHFPYGHVTELLDQMELSPSLGDILKAFASSLYVSAASTDHGVRMASLSCMSALLNVQDTLPAILEWMTHTSDTDSAIRVARISIACGTWLLSRRSFVEELLLMASRPDDSSRTLLRLEAMSLLSKVAKNYSPALSANWQKLADFMLAAFQDMDANVRLQAVKILENYIKGENGSSEGAMPGNLTAQDSCRVGCLDFMATHLIRAFYDTSHHVRASVCACFTLLSAQDWAWLGEKKQTRRLPVLAAKSGGTSPSVSCLDSYTRIFMQTPKDSSPVVRAAGFRLLGSLCLAPTFKTRAFASSVVGLALDALCDSTLNVRVRAAWALGNVCTTPGPEAIIESDAPPLPPPAPPSSFVAKMEASTSYPPLPPQVLYELLPPFQLRLVIEKMLVYINDNDKVASSVARTLGLVCRWTSFPSFRRTLSTKDQALLDDLLGQVMVVLAGKINAGSPKVRWNACHAIAKVLLCPNLPLASVTWAPSVFQALLTAVAQQENFKVRISAATALRVSQTRSAFGSFFQSALRATVDALETASDLKDVTEFRYKEQLETQLSFTLVHLIHVATEEDDSLILEALKAKPRGFLYDWLLHNLHRMIAAIEREGEAIARASTSGDISEDGRAGGTGDAHDVNPIKKEELLSAVRSLLRILERLNTDKAYTTSCVSLLYDTKIGLERDVLYSNEDIPFEL
ncbi:HEAT repeat-containing protein 6 [Phytophthora citrophthora]|uniref:HEAT repeat-containing protein 6 n=1 Tax=Phytophthora citrophthora TaxID=4793 RepID=A0AAD9LCW1_9STRA|nr:HEAT repeat-containing protein 6 [Phytophthora citrophthora]